MRYRVESRNRRVEITLDMLEIQRLADLSGKTLGETIAAFKPAGVTSIAIVEQTVGDLMQSGRITAQTDTAGPLWHVQDNRLLARMRNEFRARGFVPISASPSGPAKPAKTRFVSKSDGFGLAADIDTIRTFGIGLDPAGLSAVRSAGLTPVARISNFPGASETTMSNVLARLSASGVATVIFQGTEVFGYRGLYAQAAAAFTQMPMLFGKVEFGKQKGEDSLSVALNSSYVRVHSISEGEMATLDESEAIDRLARAARERNIRLCYIRMLTFSGADALERNVGYISSITRATSRGGEMKFGKAHPFDEPGVPAWARVIMALGVAAAAALLVASAAPVGEFAPKAVLALAAVVCVGLVVASPQMGAKLVALVAAIVFPTLGCLHRGILSRGYSAETPFPAKRAAAALITASAVTFVGAVYVVGLLAMRTFMVKTDGFAGIKAAHGLPLLILAVLAVTGLPSLGSDARSKLAAMRERAAAFLGEPTRVGGLLLALVALGVVALILMRTGNEPGVGVSGIELKFRALLDRFLPARPRTKEFLIGHPAFVVALGLWYRGRSKWAPPLFVVGAIGQVSILNTFCHIHTPLYLSGVRAVTGLIVGGLIGCAALWLIWLMQSRSARRAPA